MTPNPQHNLKKLLALGLAVALLLGVGAGRSNAEIIVFNSRPNWEAAVGGVFTLEDFNDGVANGFTLTPNGPGHTVFGISGGEFHDRLQPGSSTTITFSQPQSAFGADWDLAGPGGMGLGIQIVAGGSPVPVEVPNSLSGQFFGFTSSVPFTAIVLTTGTQPGVAETYDADNFVFSNNVVPAPPSIVLAGVGALGLIGRRYCWRRKPKA